MKGKRTSKSKSNTPSKTDATPAVFHPEGLLPNLVPNSEIENVKVRLTVVTANDPSHNQPSSPINSFLLEHDLREALDLFTERVNNLKYSKNLCLGIGMIFLIVAIYICVFLKSDPFPLINSSNFIERHFLRFLFSASLMGITGFFFKQFKKKMDTTDECLKEKSYVSIKIALLKHAVATSDAATKNRMIDEIFNDRKDQIMKRWETTPNLEIEKLDATANEALHEFDSIKDNFKKSLWRKIL